MRVKSFFSLLFNQRGQLGTTDPAPEAPADTGPAPAAPESTEQQTDPEAGTTDQAETAEETFVDPATLPPELKAHWKRMHGSFTKKMQEIREVKQKAAEYDRLSSDPDYARRVIMESAPRLGIALAPETKPTATPTNGNGSDVPAEFVEAVRTAIRNGKNPEMEWMAEQQASTYWALHKQTMQPILEKQKAEQHKARLEEFERLSAELTAEDPNWQESEDEMNEILSFFMDTSRLVHPKLGSKLALLRRIAKGDGPAVQAAIDRMSSAPRNRTATGRPAASTESNVTDRVRKAKTNDEAFKIAAAAAVDQLKRGAS